MGLFKNLNDMYKAGGEPLGSGRHAKRSEAMAGAQAKMAAAQEMMAEQTRLVALATNGADASATILDTRQTAQTINHEPVIELDVTMILDGRPPYPLTVRQGVPPLHLAKAQAGGVLRAKVDPADPTAVFLDFARS